MSPINSPSPQTRFLELLRRDVLKIDLADLDFGIYRILNFRRAEVLKFLDVTLPARIRVQTDALAAAHGRELATEEEANVYYHLHTFFSRYWDEGDFIPRARRGGSAAYAVPYRGEDTYFHWATKGSHYIKSGEFFSRYAYTQGAGDASTTVIFAIDRADTEKTNAKGEKRHFFPHRLEKQGQSLTIFWQWRTATPDENKRYGDKKTKAAKRTDEDADDSADADNDSDAIETVEAVEGNGLQEKVINAWLGGQGFATALPPASMDAALLEKHVRRFVRKHTSDFFVHPQLKAFLEGELDVYLKHEFVQVWDAKDEELPRIRSKFALVRAIALDLIAFLDQIERFQATLFEKRKFVTRADYLVQVSGLLRTQHADAQALIDEAAADAAQVNEWLQWVGEKPLAENAAQGSVASPRGRGRRKAAGEEKEVGTALLSRFPHLPIHTKHFDRAFRDRLLACFSDIEAATGGELFHADNYAALRTMEPAYKNRVKCIYIDPPYNTGSDGFLYKDQLQRATWISMIGGRVQLARELMAPTGMLFSHISLLEQRNLVESLAHAFGIENRVEELIWVQHTTYSQSPTYSTNHEYVQAFARDKSAVELDALSFREKKPGLTEVNELLSELGPDFPSPELIEEKVAELFKQHESSLIESLEADGIEFDRALDTWRSVYSYSHAEYRDAEGNFVPHEKAREANARIWLWSDDKPSMPANKQAASTRDPAHFNFRFYRPLHPITKQPCSPPKQGWSFPFAPDPSDPQRPSFQKLAAQNRIIFGENERKSPRLKKFLNEVESNVAKSVLHDYTAGEKELTSLMGATNSFPNPKPTTLAARLSSQVSRRNDPVLDFFAGSGTTGHAVINLNREDGGARKFILVEQGEYFDTVTLPRIAKVMASPEWKDGKPKEGVNHDAATADEAAEHWSRRTLPIVRVLRLEHYEDSLDALDLSASAANDAPQNALPLAETADDTLIRYALTDASEGSPVLLSTEALKTPFEYRLSTLTPDLNGASAIEMMETIRLLIGLLPQRIRAIRDEAGNRHELMEATLASDAAKGVSNPAPVLVWLRNANDDCDMEAAKTERDWLQATVKREFKRSLADYATIFHNRSALWLPGERGESLDSLLRDRMMERAQ